VAEAGGQVRVTDTVPMKLLVRDAVEAMISLCDSLTGEQGLTSAVIRHPDLVRALQLLFEREWLAALQGSTEQGLRRGAALCGLQHRVDDLVVAGAAAEVAGESLAYLGLGRVGVAVKQRLGRHQHAGGAEAAL